MLSLRCDSNPPKPLICHELKNFSFVVTECAPPSGAAPCSADFPICESISRAQLAHTSILLKPHHRSSISLQSQPLKNFSFVVTQPSQLPASPAVDASNASTLNPATPHSISCNADKLSASIPSERSSHSISPVTTNPTLLTSDLNRRNPFISQPLKIFSFAVSEKSALPLRPRFDRTMIARPHVSYARFPRGAGTRNLFCESV